MENAEMIEPCKPEVWHYSYSNPDSQGALMNRTRNWPVARQSPHRHEIDLMQYEFMTLGDIYTRPDRPEAPVPIPDGLAIDSAYVDRMQEWDRAKYGRAAEHLPYGGLRNASDDQLIQFAATYFEQKVVAVRVVYYFNASNGFCCPRIDYLFEARPSECSADERDPAENTELQTDNTDA